MAKKSVPKVSTIALEDLHGRDRDLAYVTLCKLNVEGASCVRQLIEGDFVCVIPFHGYDVTSARFPTIGELNSHLYDVFFLSMEQDVRLRPYAHVGIVPDDARDVRESYIKGE